MAPNDSNDRVTWSTRLAVAAFSVGLCVAVTWMLSTDNNRRRWMSVDDVLNPVEVAEDLQDYANREKKKEVVKVKYGARMRFYQTICLCGAFVISVISQPNNYFTSTTE
jgi:hypothetical protein